MYKSFTIGLLVCLTLIALGCNGGSNPALTSLGQDKAASASNSDGAPPAPPAPPPVAGPPPPPQFWEGCLSFYKFEFVAILPDGNQKEGLGNLTIFNKGCASDEAEVMVRFMFGHIPVDKRALFVPGKMIITDTGAVVTGEFNFKKGDDSKGCEIHESYKLIITGDPGLVEKQTITGTLFIERHCWFTLPDGTLVDKDHKWTFDISGVGALPPPPPKWKDPGKNPPPPPYGGNPPPPPPPYGGNPPPPPPPGGGGPGKNPPPLPPDDGA